MKFSLQVRHTWVSAMTSLRLQSVPQESGRRVRTSGGIRLIGASPFFKDQTRRRISQASRSRTST